MIHKDGGIEEGVTHRTRVKWMKSRDASRLLSDCKITIKFKEKILKDCYKISYVNLNHLKSF